MRGEKAGWLLLGCALALPAVVIPCWNRSLASVSAPGFEVPSPAMPMPPPQAPQPRALPEPAPEPLPAPWDPADPVKDALASQRGLAYAPQVDRDPMMSEADMRALSPTREPQPPAPVRSPRRSPAPKLTVQAIMEIGGAFTAIVNDKTVRVGDQVSGARVSRIRLDRVEFRHDGRTVVKEFR